ncbi:MAG: hypothetical protein QXP02_01555 [Desulfurococcaceae archaeon]
MDTSISQTPVNYLDSQEMSVDDLIDTILVNYELYVNTWDERTYIGLIRLMNKYFELVTPIKYLPRAAELLQERLVLRLWESKIPIELLREFMRQIITLKELASRRDDRIIYEYEKANEVLNKILSELSDRSTPINLNKFSECNEDIYEKSLCLISLSIIVLIISTNPG